MKTSFKISEFEDFCYGPGMLFWSKFENDLNFLILFYSSRKHEDIMLAIELEDFD